MLQWTMRYSSVMGCYCVNGEATEVPITSLRRVARAYHDGQSVWEWYDSQARTTQTLISPSSTNIDSQLELAVAVEDNLGGCVAIVDVTDRLARGSGWAVYRVIAPNALSFVDDSYMENLIFRRAMKRIIDSNMRRAVTRMNPAPLPFG